jgi:hypothetical protein
MLALLGGSFAHAIQTGLVSFMVSVRKVEASDSESSIDKLLELRDVPACGAQRANNLALAFLGLGLGHDLFKSNVGAAEFRAGSGYFGIREGHDVVDEDEGEICGQYQSRMKIVRGEKADGRCGVRLLATNARNESGHRVACGAVIQQRDETA